eukprot:1159522-Pelagomonas_calceolata.AAC.10
MACDKTRAYAPTQLWPSALLCTHANVQAQPQKKVVGLASLSCLLPLPPGSQPAFYPNSVCPGMSPLAATNR